MTKAQTQLYFREWASVRKAKPDADRHALHIAALGVDKSSKAFSNSDFDRVLGVFRAISQPGNLNAQLRQSEQVRHRLEHRLSEILQCLGLYVDDPCVYVAKVMADKFGNSVTGLDDLSHEPRLVRDEQSQEMSAKPSELLMLVMTLWDRVQALRRKRGDSLADMFQQAGIAVAKFGKGAGEPAPAKARRRATSAEREAQPVAVGEEDPF
jgi:hypothetical protein